MTEMVTWCSGCNAEQAVQSIEIEIHDEWVEIPIGSGCLTKLEKLGRIEL